MRVCYICAQVNSDTATACTNCGVDISAARVLPPTAPIARRLPDVVERRNRSYRLLLVLLPFAVALALWFWLDMIPGIFHEAAKTRAAQLAMAQEAIEKALTACRRDTGGLPMRLEVLQQYTVAAADLTLGARLAGWKGPYLLPGAFPRNPYLPRAGVAGWRYRVSAGEWHVAPAHARPAR